MMRWLYEASRYLFLAIRNSWRFAYGCYWLFRLKGPVITVFGGSRMDKDSINARIVYDFASLCAKNGLSILTGGGPGVMEAASCGARDGHVHCIQDNPGEFHTLGIGVKGLDQGFHNPCARVIKVNDFATRKRLLILYSKAIVVFPGGIGTADELFDVLSRINEHSLDANIPVILVDRAFWRSLYSWYQESAKSGLIKAESKDLLLCADSAQEAFDIIHACLNK